MTLCVAFQPLLPFDAEPEATTTSPDSLLVEELARVCRERPLEEKILVAPSLAVGRQLVERVARSGTPWINLRVETPRTLAHSLVGAELARQGCGLLSRAQALALVEQACVEALGPGSYFGGLSDRPGLHRALQATLDELRAAGLSPEAIPESAFSDPKKHRELREVFRRHAAALEAGNVADGIEVLRRAAQALEAGRCAAEGATYILPSAAELSALERGFLERLAADRLVALAADPPEAWENAARAARLFRAIGEENEIREVFRRILSGGIAFDEVEILHTDPAIYPALVWELSREHEIPCTFAGGIPAAGTRPGRAARAFLDWIGQDFAAEVLRQALAAGALTLQRQDGASEPGARVVARVIRRAGLGWGRNRHLSRLDHLVGELEKPEPRSRRDEAEATPERMAQRAAARARDLQAARRARRFVERALELAPRSREGPGDLRRLAAGARAFVAEFARVGDETDATAATALDALFEEFEELVAPPISVATAVERLRDAVERLSIGADRPRPGRVHVAHYASGGFSGRRYTFLIGLDEGRHPGQDLEDPILLDEERRRINDGLDRPRLALGRQRPRDAAAALKACAARLRGTLTASYSSFDLRNLSQAGEPAPSPFFLDLFRRQSGRPEADYQDLARALPAAAGFVPAEGDALDESEWWIAKLRLAGPAASGEAAGRLVRAAYPWLQDGHRAAEARDSEAFTTWDGWVRGGTPELDPRASGRPVSASRVQELARCPFAYFVRRVLGVEPPDDVERDPTRWLDPMGEGSLLHEVFRVFFERITEAGERPGQAGHLESILGVADEQIAAWRERITPASELAFAMQRERIRFACRTLLRREQERSADATPRYFEVPFGLPREIARSRAPIASPDPVEIPAGEGRSLLLRGSIDRVDEAPDGTFHVWDYKTGSAWGIQEGRGLRGGRQVQPALYAIAFEALLERAGRTGRVSQSGYFLPGQRGEGQRITMPLDRAETRRVLGRLFDLVAAGMFPHALSAEDCTNCELGSVCGGRTAGERARTKLEKSGDPVLAAFREIHAPEA
ncbi:MAG: PD-(D/E)XK nuclease family protein [Acidobacteriota bacterium]